MNRQFRMIWSRIGSVTGPAAISASGKSAMQKRSPSSSADCARIRPKLKVAELIAQGLGGKRDIAVDLGTQRRDRHRQMPGQIVDRLVAAPAFRVQDRIDDQPQRAEQFPFKPAVALLRRVVEAQPSRQAE